MAFEQRDNSGALFKNSDKAKDSQPDYSGTAKIGGKEMQISAWLKKAKSGQTFMSLAFSIRGEQRQTEKPAKREEPAPPDESEDLPF